MIPSTPQITINHAKLAQHLQAAEAQVRAAIARMTTPTALRLNLNIDSTAPFTY